MMLVCQKGSEGKHSLEETLRPSLIAALKKKTLSAFFSVNIKVYYKHLNNTRILTYISYLNNVLI